MKRKFLEELGLDKEVIDKIMAEHGSGIEAVKTEFSGKAEELTKAQELIEELKKSSKGNEDLQGKITGYESELETLREENEKLRVDTDLKVALLAAGAKAEDIDYLMFKLREKNELTLGDDKKIKGLESITAAAKTQYPNQFAAQEQKKVEENKLPGQDPDKKDEPKDLSEALRMQYENREE